MARESRDENSTDRAGSTVAQSCASTKSAPVANTHLGDLTSTTKAAQPTRLTEPAALPDGFSPLERIVMTASGNLQRIISAYYNALVTVDVLLFTLEAESPVPRYSRQVSLTCLGKVFCIATSTIVIHDTHCHELFRTGACGLGQLFRHLDLLPTFTLHSAARLTDSTALDSPWTRSYRLEAPGRIECDIREDFCDHLFSLNDAQ